MNLLYNSGIAAYAALARVAAMRSEKVKTMLRGQAEASAKVDEARRRVAPQGFDVWFHAASLGEFEQARPLIEMLKERRPKLTVLLTFFSPSGYEVRKDYKFADCVAYLPFDRPAAVRRFLDAAQPRTAIFVKYEFWGNYMSQLKSRGIPVFLIDAIFRPGQIFFRSYGATFRNILHCYTHIFVQDEASRQLLASVGVTDVTVAGDTRFDRVTQVMNTRVNLPAIEEWLKDSPFTFIAGSSWQPDEECYIPWLNSHPEVRAIIAPHEFDAARLDKLRKQLAAPAVLWSDIVASGKPIPRDTRTVIIDTFGLLSSLYRFGSVALVGGGFGAGIHNINEAAVYGIPVLFAPNHRKFKEAADLIAAGGAFEYTDANMLSAHLDRFLKSPPDLDAAGHRAGEYIKEHLGASELIYAHLGL